MNTSKLFVASLVALGALSINAAQAASWVNGDVYGFAKTSVQSATSGHPQQQMLTPDQMTPPQRFYLDTEGHHIKAPANSNGS